MVLIENFASMTVYQIHCLLSLFKNLKESGQKLSFELKTFRLHVMFKFFSYIMRIDNNV